MQPCSQPRNALIERSKPTSGELLRVRMDLGCSIVTVVRRGGTPSRASTVSSQSPSRARAFRLKRVGVGLRVAPRPRFDSTGMAHDYAERWNISRTLMCNLCGAQARVSVAKRLVVQPGHAGGEGRPAVLHHRL